MIKNQAGKGAVYLYIQLILSMISGYIFLILVARITTAENIGTFSLLVSISEIFANIAIIGLPDSIRKFVGKSFLQEKQADAKVFIKISFIILSVSLITSCMVIVSLRDWLSNIFDLDFHLIIVVELLIISYAVYSVLYSVTVSTLKTKVLPVIMIVSSIAKVILALSLVSMGYGILGLTLGYTLFGQVLSSALLSIFILKVFRFTKKTSEPAVTLRKASKDLLIGGLVIWTPVLITTLGIDLGTLVLYNTYGSHESGVYFIALTIANAIYAIVYSIFTISLPVLSSMNNGRKRFVSKTIRITALFALPLSSSIIFYSNDIMHLIGSNYELGSLSLKILLLSAFPIIVLSGVETLVFSYGQYRYTLTIALASSLPRTILYFTLVPIFGMTGVAISYTAGSVVGLIASVVVAHRIRMPIYWKPLVLALFLPVSIGFLLATLNVNYIVGITTTIIFTYLLLMKLHVIEKTDGSLFTELMPDKISKPLITIYPRFEKIIDWFYGRRK
jgi:O-antigen/teichoic acid export membrane protein